ncbi:beta-lactam-binding protein with PASTA domain [Kibdelosporangium banguiense]|uniref:Beta-lactam-binding protein with PASTA domain n=1 Tax=Kibdelosporangium banguiense TaxID=1365924 RepID=A0ABS4TB78_9PSEU|nr:PASTA domain-containing protein [Kibdelosporangium banguiense]MBP2321676.1 beta-lactam-binding protein with PASTA domain [Kibdelosporangium banguiense]
MRKALLAGLLLLAACSSPPPQQPQPPPPAEAVIGQTVVPGTKAPSGNLVPNVVGMDHQDAQNALQAAGFYVLGEEDATGRNRKLIIDHNWVVVEQIPKAGTVLDPKQRITLRSKKKDD